MKKEYEAPVCEIVEFENEDILTVSNPPYEGELS